MVHGVAVVWFPVTDMDRAKRFYGETLELKSLSDKGEWAEFEASGLRIGLNARDEETPEGQGGGVLAFQPDGPIEDAVKELEDRGVKFAGDVAEHPWGKIAAFQDPDGNDLQLYAPPSS